MGVSSNLLINSKYNVKDVVKLLTGLGVKVTQEKHNGDHSFLSFDQGGLLRHLYVAHSSGYGAISGTILSYSSNPEGIELFRKIAAVTGGFLQENDCGNEWESIDSPHEGNANFILKHQILSQAISDTNIADKIANAMGYK